MHWEKRWCVGVGVGNNAFAKRIDSGQPAQSAQADLGRNILLLVRYLSICQRICGVLHGSVIKMYVS